MHVLSKTYPVTIYGEYAEEGAASFQPIVLLELGASRCLAKMCGEPPSHGTAVDVWIGALGPLKAQVDKSESDQLKLKFHLPIDLAVVSHFAGQ
jgi:hypothetical protein